MIKCEHGKTKYKCKECGGSAICVHKRRKTTCKECGGSAICEHGRQKYYCKDCKGIIRHKINTVENPQVKTPQVKPPQNCKKGGAIICEHGRQKAVCKECGGTSICKHNIRKARCVECGGKELCIHGSRKIICKECGGKSICSHGKIKYVCVECRGSSICEHNIKKSICKVCKGSSICVHNIIKSICKACGGSSLCKTENCETFGNTKYNGYCMPCCVQVCPEITVSRNYKTKERDVVDRIKIFFPNLNWISDKTIVGGVSKRRPDLLLDMSSHIIICEIDENHHMNYDCICENKRLMEISQDLQHRPIIFIRFNPDSYTNQAGNFIKSCWKLNKLGVVNIIKNKQTEWEYRIECLKQQIQYWIDNKTEKTIEIVELFY
jgi:hypothetical protein